MVSKASTVHEENIIVFYSEWLLRKKTSWLIRKAAKALRYTAFLSGSVNICSEAVDLFGSIYLPVKKRSQISWLLPSNNSCHWYSALLLLIMVQTLLTRNVGCLPCTCTDTFLQAYLTLNGTLLKCHSALGMLVLLLLMCMCETHKITGLVAQIIYWTEILCERPELKCEEKTTNTG